MANSLTLSAALPVRAIILADAEFTPIWEYDRQTNQRTDVQRTNDAGQPLFALRNVPAMIDGDQDQITLQATSALQIQGGAILSPADGAEQTVTVRANSREGSRFADLAITVFSDEWTVVGDLANAFA